MSSKEMMTPDWVVRNIVNLGNSLVPFKDVQKHGVKRLEAYLTDKTASNVRIVKTEIDKRANGNVDFTNSDEMRKKRNIIVDYIAWRY